MRKPVILAVVLAVVVGGWSAAWAYGRSRVLAEMDAAVARLADRGIEVSCPDRSAGGWPFRLEVTCAGPSATLADGRRLGASALAVTWHVVDPRLVIAEAASPLTLEGPGTAASTVFDELRASLRLEDEGVARVSVEAARPVTVVTAAPGPLGGLSELSADRAELHVRTTPGHDGGLDIAATATGLAAVATDGPVLPAPAAAGLDVTVLKAALLGAPGGATAWSAAGGRVDLREATLVVGDTRITAEGAGTLEPDGTPTATLDAVATDVAWLTSTAEAGRPLPPALAALGSAFLLLGRPVEGEGSPRALTIAVDAGAVTANGLAIATVPPLAPPAGGS